MHEIYCVGNTARAWDRRDKRRSSKHLSNSKRVVRNLEEWNVGTKGQRPKQDITRAKAPTIELSEGHELLYHRLD